MAQITVEIPELVKKSFGNRKRISFNELYKKMEQDNWIDIELDKPMEMGEFYNLIEQEL